MAIPEMKFGLIVPEMLVNAERLHNRFIKDGMNELAVEHHKKRIPGHFKRSAISKYGYAPRISMVGRLSYPAWKLRKFGSSEPLVKTGKSRDVITTQRQVTTGGSAGRGFNFKLTMRFPFAGGTGRKKATNRKAGVTPDVMVKEVQAVTQDEIREMSASLASGYVRRVMTNTSPRQRIKV